MENTSESAQTTPRKKYNFSDISILYRQSNGTYLNLSSFEMAETKELAYLNFRNGLIIKLENVKSQYALALFRTFGTGSDATEKRYVCKITLQEILALTNISGNRFANQVKAGTGAEGEDILALICAKKILNYGYGKCQLVCYDDSEAVYEFLRNNGRNEYFTVLTKSFVAEE